MLSGKHFRRRHDRRLVIIVRGICHRQERYDRLSGTDISLNQPLHDIRASHIALHFRERPLLRAGQLIRQSGNQLISKGILPEFKFVGFLDPLLLVVLHI